MPIKKEIAEKEAPVHTAKPSHLDSNEELISSMNKLVTRIDKMVSLFEEASKNVADVESTEAKIAMLSNRLDNLLEQNKSILQGLLLLEKYIRGKTDLQQ